MRLIRLFTYLQPISAKLEVIFEVCVTSELLIGGQLLNNLHRILERVRYDEVKRDVVANLYRDCANLYLEFLQLWIFFGVVRDAWSEFFIEENHSVSKLDLSDDFNSDYWEKKYLVRKFNSQTSTMMQTVSMVPVFSGAV